MNINENVNFNAHIVGRDSNNIDTIAMYLAATIDTANMNISITCNTVNKAIVISDAENVKAQYEEFEALVKERAKELGYVIF